MPCIGLGSLRSTHPALVQVKDYVSDTDADDDDVDDDEAGGDADERRPRKRAKAKAGARAKAKAGARPKSKSTKKPGKSTVASSSKEDKHRTPQEYLVGFTMVPPNVMGERIQNFAPVRSFDMCGKRKRASGVCYIVERAELYIVERAELPIR